ncbi:hypothetical protein FB446DRAFT_709066 [Lentinula raphanica]|uniref:Uncharacterized protein n=1 Tax=Lentinula raphanica TaxID=153919 RepID=A0AA38P8C2_9AGAR|nr:hypothetical protein FB446DRAFT_709066 [Lentinula raphanica]KAJ3838207.1 hypothetical protein F5878DRAFT_710309 [Lentinula raphanica]
MSPDRGVAGSGIDGGLDGSVIREILDFVLPPLRELDVIKERFRKEAGIDIADLIDKGSDSSAVSMSIFCWEAMLAFLWVGISWKEETDAPLKDARSESPADFCRSWTFASFRRGISDEIPSAALVEVDPDTMNIGAEGGVELEVEEGGRETVIGVFEISLPHLLGTYVVGVWKEQVEAAVATDALLSLVSLDTDVSASASEWMDFFLDRPSNGIREDLFSEGKVEEDDKFSVMEDEDPLLLVQLGPLEEPRKK